MSASSRKLAKRACDGCKIRKIKCTELAPCDGCVAAGIACTFVKQPSTRGPRRLRKSTLREITQSQQQWEHLGFGSETPDGPVVHTKLDEESVFAPNKIAALVLQLCVYRLRMYPVWPIIKVERLVASLQKTEPDIEVFGLAYAVAAATIVQIRSKPSTHPGAVTAEMMEAQCQYAKVRRDPSQPPDLTTVRIPFFLHMYYENLEPGGIKSITYLREAIAIAHMIGLHRETYYSDVQPEEREIRRRTLWLLFVAERNVAISHKLPVTIRTKIAFPGTIDSDSEHVLAAYQKLVTMFWDFDRSGVFELLDRCDFDFTAAAGAKPPPSLVSALTITRKKLDDHPINTENMEDAQAFDLLVTRQWMRMILWRLTQNKPGSGKSTDRVQDLLQEPLEIVKELLAGIARTPDNAVEVHTFVLETKVFEIVISILDVIRFACNTIDTDSGFAECFQGILLRLRAFLSQNNGLEKKLQDHVDEVQQQTQSRPHIRSALFAAMESPLKITDILSLDSHTSLGSSESPTSSTGILSASQTSMSPRSHWLVQPGHSISSPNTPDDLMFNLQYTSLQETLDPYYMDMDWSQYAQSPGREFPTSSNESWNGMNFVFGGT